MATELPWQNTKTTTFFLMFDLTSTREASKSLTLFPELTGAVLTLKLTFAAALTEAVELFLIGERFSHITIDASRNIVKNCFHSFFHSF